VARCRITVLERTLNAPLAEQYGGHQPVPLCEDFSDGQVFLLDDAGRPEGFCGSAWESISKYVFAFVSGGRAFYGDWMKDPDTMIACCNDGLRPVVFLLERIDD
jgi:uncharacterized repeat protein (TIGR04076 family)